MTFLRPIKWYHSHADPFWPDGTFNLTLYILLWKNLREQPIHNIIFKYYYPLPGVHIIGINMCTSIHNI